jgi:hypothetical protein
LCGVCHGGFERPTTCIMANSRIPITGNDVLCDACKSDMREYLINNNYHVAE